MTEIVIGGLAKPAIEIAIEKIADRVPEFKVFWSSARQSRRAVRLSAAVLLHVVDEHGMLPLIKNVKRAHLYAPVGGVIRTLEHQPMALKKIAFKPELVGEGRTPGEARDLRGTIEGKHLMEFVEWFATGRDRETFRQAMVRELVEEICEFGGECSSADFADVDFHTVRTCVELPFWPNPEKKEGYMQFRWLEIVEPHSASCRERVLDLVDRSSGILRVSSNDIELGYTNKGDLIAPNADYLIGVKRTHPEPAPYPVRETS